MYLSAKGKTKKIDFKNIKMNQRESLYYKELKSYERFVDRETEEITLENFIPNLHSLILGHILSCCQSLKHIEI